MMCCSLFRHQMFSIRYRISLPCKENDFEEIVSCSTWLCFDIQLKRIKDHPASITSAFIYSYWFWINSKDTIHRPLTYVNRWVAGVRIIHASLHNKKNPFSRNGKFTEAVDIFGNEPPFDLCPSMNRSSMFSNSLAVHSVALFLFKNDVILRSVPTSNTNRSNQHSLISCTPGETNQSATGQRKSEEWSSISDLTITILHLPSNISTISK